MSFCKYELDRIVIFFFFWGVIKNNIIKYTDKYWQNLFWQIRLYISSRII